MSLFHTVTCIDLVSVLCARIFSADATTYFLLQLMLMPLPLTTDNKGGAEHGKGEAVSVLSLIRHPGVAVNIAITCVCFINTGYMDVSLAKHLEIYDLSMKSIGGLFFLTSGVYVLTNQVSAFMIHRKGSLARPLILAGFACSAVMFFLSGPMWPLPFPETLALVIVKQVIFGMSIGPQLVGSFSDGSAETAKAGFPDGMATSAAFSALFTTAMTLGACLGPAVGGVMVDRIGYAKASTVLFSIQVVMVGSDREREILMPCSLFCSQVLVLIIHVVCRRRKGVRDPQSFSPKDTEQDAGVQQRQPQQQSQQTTSL